MVSSWIVSISFENWLKLRETSVWALESENMTKRIVPGDRILLYVGKTNCVCGCYRLVGPWYKSDTPFWFDEVQDKEVKYPFQIKIEKALEGIADIGVLKDELGFITNKKDWMNYVRGVPANFRRVLPESDAEIILKSVSENQLPADLSTLYRGITRKGP